MTKRLSGEQYRLLVEHSPVMVWRAGLNAKCDYFNETWLRFTGRTLEQEVGDGWVEGVHPDDLLRCMATYLGHFQRREAFEMEYRLRRHDGEYRYIFDRGVPFTDDTGAFAGFIGSCVDVQQRRQIEHDKTAFMAMLAHELRTPITAVTAFVEGMRRRSRRGEVIADEPFRRVDAQLGEVEKLVHDLSEAVRLEEGRPPQLELEHADLSAIVTSVVRRYHERVASRVVVDRGHALSVTGAERPRIIKGDRASLEATVAGLVDNAVKFSPRGGHIELALETEQGEHVLTVRDHGIGIADGDVENVTRRFFRASNVSSEQYPGLGLGLALARDVVEGHGGLLGVSSREGEGTSVTVRLPVASTLARGLS